MKQKKGVIDFDTENRLIQSKPWASIPHSPNLSPVNKNYEQKQFNFDFLLPPKISQKSVYDIVAKPVVDSVMKGFNGTILAYGQV